MAEGFLLLLHQSRACNAGQRSRAGTPSIRGGDSKPRSAVLLKRVAVAGLTALAFAGCGEKPAVSGPDSSKTGLKSPPAVVGGERHKGPYAVGKSLSLDAVLKPLDLDPVKVIQIDTTHKVIDLAPRVKFAA